MKRNRTLIKRRRNGAAVFKDYPALQDPAPTRPPRPTRYSDREVISPLDTNNSSLSASPGYSLGIPAAKSLEDGTASEGTSSTDLDQKMVGEEEEGECTDIDSLLNQGLTWLAVSITPLVGGLFNLPRPKKPRNQHPHGNNPSIVIELLARIDELLDEIQNHGLYQGHPDKLIDCSTNSYNSPTRRHRYTHHLPIPHARRISSPFETSNLSKTLWVLKEEADESSSDCDPDIPDSQYEEGDGCALSLLELGTPLPSLPSKWSQVVMEVQPLAIRLALAVEPRSAPLRYGR